MSKKTKTPAPATSKPEPSSPEIGGESAATSGSAQPGTGAGPAAKPQPATAPKDRRDPRAAKSGPKAAKAGSKRTRAAVGRPKAKGGTKRSGMSGLDAAAKVLADAGKPMRCQDVVERVLAKGLWKTSGKTPAATIHSAVIREIKLKGKQSRFKKAGRGLFTAR